MLWCLNPRRHWDELEWVESLWGRRQEKCWQKSTSSSLYALASTAELCLCDKSISIRGFMRETSVLIVLIKNMNVRYFTHLRSPSANGFPRLVFRVFRGAVAGGKICLRWASCVSLGENKWLCLISWQGCLVLVFAEACGYICLPRWGNIGAALYRNGTDEFTVRESLLFRIAV